MKKKTASDRNKVQLLCYFVTQKLYCCSSISDVQHTKEKMRYKIELYSINVFWRSMDVIYVSIKIII